MFKDNLRLVALHIKLLFELPLHLPTLVRRHLFSAKDASWHKQQERGTGWALKLGAFLLGTFGRKVFYILLYPIVAYFFLTSPRERRISYAYLQRIYNDPRGKETLGRRPGLFMVYRHFLEFGRTMVDRLSVWGVKLDLSKVHWNNLDELKTMHENGKGAIFVSAHLGAVEVVRALSEGLNGVTVKALMFTEHVNKFKALNQAINPDADMQIIAVEDINPTTVLSLKDDIKRGEFIALLGDRTAPGSQDRTRSMPFLGGEAHFPEGPWVLASLLESPVFLVFCLRDSIDSYSVHFEKFSEQIKLPRKQREESLKSYMQSYTRHLEKYCLRSPLQWFNFFEFWHTNEQTPQTETRSISKNAV